MEGVALTLDDEHYLPQVCGGSGDRGGEDTKEGYVRLLTCCEKKDHGNR